MGAKGSGRRYWPKVGVVPEPAGNYVPGKAPSWMSTEAKSEFVRIRRLCADGKLRIQPQYRAGLVAYCVAYGELKDPAQMEKASHQVRQWMVQLQWLPNSIPMAEKKDAVIGEQTTFLTPPKPRLAN